MGTENKLEPITNEWLDKAGCFLIAPLGRTIILPSHQTEFKVLSISPNDFDNGIPTFYVYIRQGDKGKSRLLDDIVCLRSDLKYISELENLYFAITGKTINFKN